ncbi:MAG: rhomboid family intramembrane serine protease [Bacteroidota bacterium]
MGSEITPVVRNILAVNILVHLIGFVTQSSGVITALFGLHHWTSEYFGIWQVVTHMFVHSDLMHIFFNMIGLYMFGPLLEMVWGARRFFIYYMVCGIGGGMIHLAVNGYEVRNMQRDAIAYAVEPSPEGLERFLFKYAKGVIVDKNVINDYYNNPNSPAIMSASAESLMEITKHRIDTPMIGASGAIFGILLAFAVLFPNTELMLLFPPIPIQAKYLVGIYTLIELYQGFISTSRDNVAHFAHLGGMLVGFLLIRIWQLQRKRFY